MDSRDFALFAALPACRAPSPSTLFAAAQEGPAHRRALLSISSLSSAKYATDVAFCTAAAKVRTTAGAP